MKVELAEVWVGGNGEEFRDMVGFYLSNQVLENILKTEFMSRILNVTEMWEEF